ncbi:MAG: ATP-dependent sacrificial sulfur transferase LarE, partial [Armatimonadetes bacterium]|nr:ATP-dependent sacrificial sulfur transferase LarE [Armatimonadota bacterium]
CKSELFSKLRVVAQQRGIRWIVDGTNYDDLGDHRPGRAAAREKDVRSPLLEAELTKAEIRHLSQALGLPTWDKPEAACLASRIPHGTPVTKQALRQIEDSEAFLKTLGFRQVRVRHHETLARIEVAEEEIELFLHPERRRQITAMLRDLGYTHVTVDLAGYRRGSNNGEPASPTLVQIDV